MASGKKYKKSKGKTLALNEFLLENVGSVATPLRKNSTSFSWAEDVEDTYHSYEGRSKPMLILPTAPKAAREVEDFSSAIPVQPPFTAYLSNLPYDSNENEIAKLFGNLKISNMRIPKDDRFKETPRLKGFGYIDFENRNDLISVLSIQDCVLRTRHIKIKIATNLETDKTKDRSKTIHMRTFRNQFHSTKVWKTEQNDFTAIKDCNRVSEKCESVAWRSENLKLNQENHRRYNNCVKSDSIEHKSKQQKSRHYRNNHQQNKTYDTCNKIDISHTRPKLNLQPRTKPIEDTLMLINKTINTQCPSETCNAIFGNAKPVDTSIRERQIEERLAKEKENSHNHLDAVRNDKKKNQYSRYKRGSFNRTYISRDTFANYSRTEDKKTKNSIQENPTKHENQQCKNVENQLPRATISETEESKPKTCTY